MLRARQLKPLSYVRAAAHLDAWQTSGLELLGAKELRETLKPKPRTIIFTLSPASLAFGGDRDGSRGWKAWKLLVCISLLAFSLPGLSLALPRAASP